MMIQSYFTFTNRLFVRNESLCRKINYIKIVLQVLETIVIHSMAKDSWLDDGLGGGCLKGTFMCSINSPPQGGGVFIKAGAIIRMLR